MAGDNATMLAGPASGMRKSHRWSPLLCQALNRWC